jgi:branched-chain amino acid transport system permease protein
MLHSARRLALLAIVVVGATVLVDDRFFQRILVLTLLWGAAGVAWGLVAKAGQISLGHSAFTGIGALTFVVLLRDHDLSPWLGMLIGVALSVAAALLIGLPTLRLRGFYFALATAVFPLILMLLALHHGYAELSIPFHPESPLAYMQFRDPEPYVWISLALLVIVIATAEAIDRSSLGTALRAIRGNEVLARTVGIPVARSKMIVFGISAAFASVMAVVWANGILLIVTPREVFSLEVIVVMLSVAFVGGVTRTWGPVLGAALLIPLSQVMTAELGEHVPGAETLVYGAALILMALLAPDGVLPRLEPWVRRRFGRPAVAADPRGAGENRWAGIVARTEKRAAAVPGAHGLRTAGLAKRFGGVQVLQAVDLEAQPGRRVGLIGPNGAGKTTLFNLICGHLRPDGGVVEWAGRDITGLGPGARYRLGISRTFQVPQGFSGMTPAENVRAAAVGFGMGADESFDATEAVLAELGLADRAGSDLGSLTTLERKLLELARASVSVPSLLLLDEPLAGLTQPEHATFFAAVDRVVPATTTVVVVEHSVRSLVPHIEWLFALDAGRIVAAGPPGEVVADDRVIASYLGARWARVHGKAV